MVVSLAQFRASLGDPAPAAELAPALAALWWLANGDWDRAHRLAQDDPGAEAAWVHAHLHRVEGDLGNAGYWYRQAGRPVATSSLDAEWADIAAALLGDRQP